MSFGNFGERSKVRQAAYDALDSERVYQDRGMGNAKRHPGAAPLTLGEHILILEKLVVDARTAWYRPDGVEDALEHLRKIGGVAVAGMENHGVRYRNL